MNYSTKELAEITDSELIGNENLIIKNIAFDSRHIYTKVNTAFIAINTPKNSGEKYIPSAVEKGISVIISEHQTFESNSITWIIVKNSIDFLQKLAQYHFQKFPDLKSIGITGSNGKTIVKEWLYQSLCEDYNVVKSPKSFNSQLGLSISLLDIKQKDEIGIFEVGISEPGEMQKSSDIFSPKIGIFTHLGTAHLSNFENSEQLIDEKIILFRNSETIVFNGDNELVYNKIKEKFSQKKLISFGFENRNDVSIISDWQDRTQNIKVNCLGEIFEFPASKRDEATLHNALCIIATLNHLGYQSEEIIDKLNALTSVEMRLESIEGIRNNLIINDSYILDLDSLKIAYQFIKEYNKPKKSLIITDFAETKDTEEIYQQVAKITNEQNFEEIFLVGTEIQKYQSLFTAKTFTFDNTKQLIESQELYQLENRLILLKGARKFEIENVKTLLELQKHDTLLEINLNAILHNINVHKALLKPETKIMAMVKAFSYGLGGYEIAEFLQHNHIDYLTVAYADEGVELRKRGITTPIVVMNPEQHSYSTIIDYNLEPEIYSFRVLELFSNQLKQKGYHEKYPIHIKIETGMHRLGFKENEIDHLIENLKLLPVKVASIFSHLSTADMPEEKDYTFFQLQNYDRISSHLLSGLNYRPIRHVLNSSGITNFTEYQYDMVRIGIGMIGISENTEIQKKLQNTVSFKTVISQISEVKAGESVGYGRRFKPDTNTKIATIPVGYADGIPRLIGNGIGKLLVNKTEVPIVGSICMDMMMLDIDHIKANEGDPVIIFNTTEQLLKFAKYCQTIPYEVLTSISRRVKRIYIKD